MRSNVTELPISVTDLPISVTLSERYVTPWGEDVTPNVTLLGEGDAQGTS